MTKYVGRKDGKMKAFDTESEAYAYTQDSVAEYCEDGKGGLDFVRVVGIKATDKQCADLLGGSFTA
jgi:hypothetical protein